ncbi:hypothetical protein SAMN04487998_3440 [Hymenobacter actinosclerus]|uniref:Uncharacterized protein n=2 Tax=Hymenobacter actinosclerus TaxID=82805 RepID=A0A1I0IPY4_9BACT|nr:hypothetical protein SAMN04487998_3440 [Hymenobacter actinosclerus]
MERYNEKLGNGTKVFILSYTVILFNTITPLSLRLDGNGGQMLGGKLAKMFDIQPGIWTKGVTYKSASRKITLAELLSILLTEANQLRHKFSLLVS